MKTICTWCRHASEILLARTSPNQLVGNFRVEMDVVSREELYQLVWSKPMTKVAEEFNVSSSYMARICSMLNVPRPQRGYDRVHVGDDFVVLRHAK